MAQVITQVADRAHGAVFLDVQDKNGILSKHTIYVLGLNGVTVEQRIAQILTDADAQADAINAAFQAAGM